MMPRMLIILSELTRLRVTFAVSITTLAGYLLHRGDLTAALILPVTGIFLLASGASALNQVQEISYDRIMMRTMKRPVPAGDISPFASAFIAFLLLSAGSALLFFSPGIYPFLLGWMAFFWYNLVYTYLKRITAYAVIPGSLVGTFPPLIGWVVAGGSLFTPEVIPIILFFFVWQVPHFWLLILKYGEQYEAAGLPTLSRSYPEKKISKIIFSWITATALVTTVLALSGLIQSVASRFALLGISVVLIIMFIPILSASKQKHKPGTYFRRINYFVLAAILFMVFDKTLFG